MCRPDSGKPAEDIFFDPRAGRGPLAGVPPHPFCGPAVSGRVPCTLLHEGDNTGRAGEMLEDVVRQIGGRLARQRAVAAQCFGLQLLSIIAKLGFAVFLTAGFVAGLGLTSGVGLTDPIGVRLCAGFFLWSLALISCFISSHS
jgi:hypothetical protein